MNIYIIQITQVTVCFLEDYAAPMKMWWDLKSILLKGFTKLDWNMNIYIIQFILDGVFFLEDYAASVYTGWDLKVITRDPSTCYWYGKPFFPSVS